MSKSPPLIYPPKTFSQAHLNGSTLEQQRIIRPYNLIRNISADYPNDPRLDRVKLDHRTMKELTKLPDLEESNLRKPTTSSTKKVIKKSSTEVDVLFRSAVLSSTVLSSNENATKDKMKAISKSLKSEEQNEENNPLLTMSYPYKTTNTTTTTAFTSTSSGVNDKLPSSLEQSVQKMSTIQMADKKVASVEMIKTMRELERLVAGKKHLLEGLCKDENKMIQLVEVLSKLLKKKETALQEEKDEINCHMSPKSKSSSGNVSSNNNSR